MNVCSKCNSNGGCCRGFELTYLGEDIERYFRALLSIEIDHFIPKTITLKEIISATEVKETTKLIWYCTKLDGNGKCSIYENRPQLCKDYIPMSDGLCSVKHLRGIPIFVEKH